MLIARASMPSVRVVRALLALSAVAATGAILSLESCSPTATEVPCPDHAPVGVAQPDCNKQQYDSCMYLDPCNRELACICPRDQGGWQCLYVQTSCAACRSSDYMQCLTTETRFEIGGVVPVDWRPGGPPSFGDAGTD
jgi:hypothetical protein